MSIKRPNSRQANRLPDEDEQGIERAFLRLGNILAEIAQDSSQPQEAVAAPSKTKRPAVERLLTLDAECKDGDGRNLPDQ